ncbi:MAG: acyltransferase family protein [Candidatus Heimdallarchaeaceae archaeon]
MSETKEGSRNFERRYDLDWLRIIAILLVFFFHCIRPFDQMAWHINNDVQSEGMTIVMYFLGGAGMPIFFVIAGMGTFYALRKVKGGQYAFNRVIRLLVPFAIGLFTHIPLQIFIERITYGNFMSLNLTYPQLGAVLNPTYFVDGTFSQFYPTYFNGAYAYGGNFDFFGLHLWFLALLFVISLLTLPLAVHYAKDKNLDKLDKFTNFLNKPGMLFLFPIPIGLIEIGNFLTGSHIYNLGGWNVFSHLLFFIYGYLFASNIKFRRTIEKHAIPAAIIVVVCTVPLILQDSFVLSETMAQVIFWILGTIYSWCMLLLLLAFGSKFLDRNNKARKFLNELVLPFYIMHQTIIVVLGFFIVQLDMHFLAKFVILLSSAFVTCAILLTIIKYINPLRFIFGMRWKKGLLKRTKDKEVKVIESKIEDTTSTTN